MSTQEQGPKASDSYRVIRLGGDAVQVGGTVGAMSRGAVIRVRVREAGEVSNTPPAPTAGPSDGK